MALGDGVRRNIASVDPLERALLRDAMIELNRRFFPGSRSDSVPGGVCWWFKQDEIHQTTHVHNGPEFVPWHASADQSATFSALLGLDARPEGDSKREPRWWCHRDAEPVYQ